MANRLDFEIEKGSMFYQEMQLFLADGVTPSSLVGKTIEVFIKESPMTSVNLHHLTEANGGIIVIDRPTAQFALSISSSETAAVTADYGFYTVMKVDNNYPLLDTERELEGRIAYV